MSIRNLRCPSCGGPIDAASAFQASTCPFCQAAIAAAPREVVVERVEQRVVVVDGSFRCPRCAGEMRAVTVQGAKLHGCRSCGGLWVDNETVNHLHDTGDRAVEELARQVGNVVAMPMTHDQRIAELGCPTCAERMRRVAIPETMHSVDVCASHGTWFDRGELQMFADSYRTAREGDVDANDLNAAGVPGRSNGFFATVLSALFG